MAGRVVVVDEAESGRNTLFRDTRTGHEMTRSEFVQSIRAGQYPQYHVRVIDGVPTPVSNPDDSENNNLG